MKNLFVKYQRSLFISLLTIVFSISFIFPISAQDSKGKLSEEQLEAFLSKNSRQTQPDLATQNIERGDAVYQTLEAYNPGVANAQRAIEETSIVVRDARANGASEDEIKEIQQNAASYIAIQLGLLPTNSLCNENKDCFPYCYYYDYLHRMNQNGCTFCPLYKAFFNAVSRVTHISITTFSSSVFKVVIVAFAIWLAIHALKFVSSPETKDAKDFIQALLVQGFIVALVCIILNGNAMNFMNTFLSPVYNTGLTIAQETLSPTSAGKIKSSSDNNAKTEQITCKTDYGLYNTNTSPQGALPESMGNSILCTMTVIEARANKIKALASSAICLSWKKKFLYILPHLGYLFTGIGLWIGSVLLIVGVPFLLIDCVAELAVAGALLPAAIGAYAFKMTRKYSTKVWEAFLNSMFSFLFMSLIVLMLTTAFAQIMMDTTKGDLDTLITSTDSALIQDILNDIPWFSMAYLKIVFVLVLTWTMAKEARDFANEFSGNIAGTNFGSQIGTMGASAAKSVAKSVGKPLFKAAKEGVSSATKATVHVTRRALVRRQASRAQRLGTATQNADGTTTYTYQTRNWYGKKMNVSSTVGSDGTPNIKTERKSFFGDKTIVKEKNEHFSVRSKYKKDKNTGELRQVGGERIRYNSNAHRELFNKKNQLNQETFESVMSKCNDKQKIALMKTMVNQRLPGFEKNLKNNDFAQHELLKDENGQVLGYREIMKDGSVNEMKFATQGQRMMIDFTVVDKNGDGRKLSTDGIINKKQTFKSTIKRNENGQFTELDIDEKSVKSSYGLTSYYERYQRQRRSNKIDYNESMFSAEDINASADYMRKDHWWRNAGMYEFKGN